MFCNLECLYIMFKCFVQSSFQKYRLTDSLIITSTLNISRDSTRYAGIDKVEFVFISNGYIRTSPTLFVQRQCVTLGKFGLNNFVSIWLLKGRELYETFTFDSADDKMKLEPVLNKFSEHYNPRKNVTILRHNTFFTYRQLEGQSLKKLGAECEFKNLRGSLLTLSCLWLAYIFEASHSTLMTSVSKKSSVDQSDLEK